MIHLETGKYAFYIWTAYGLFTRSWPVAVFNVVCLGMSATVLALKWRFSRKA